MLHHNWFLTVFERNIIPVVWIALCVSLGLTAATYLIEPVYSVRTELILDASLKRMLPNMDGLPTTDSSDYIRPEYFAIDSVNLMQQPALGEKIIIDNKLLDSNGEKINVDKFINPSILNLLFSTNGQGITVKWISDTQQFSITGYGKDIHTAVLLSSQYTRAFIENDKKQFQTILRNLKGRREIMLNSAGKMHLAVTKEQAALRKKHGIADWDVRIANVSSALLSVENSISVEIINEATNIQSLQEYEEQLKELKKPIHLSETEQKNELLTTLQGSLTDFTTQLAVASLDFTQKHPDYRKIQTKIDVIRKQIVSERKREYLQSVHSTSTALDSAITNIMEIRVDQAARTIKVNEFNALKNRYLDELSLLGEGEALYSNLTEQKTRLHEIMLAATQDILKIEAFLENPFSFFRVTSEPFVDIDNIKNAKCLPKHKLTLLISFLVIFMICIFYVLIRELHLETLFSAWQLKELPSKFEAVDITCNNNKPFNSARHIFNSHHKTGGLIRIRRLDRKSDPRYLAQLGADFFVHAGESTLLVNNRKNYLWKQKGSQSRGLHSWLTGRIEKAAIEIQQSNRGYDVLYDSFWNPGEPWTKNRKEIKEFFSDLTDSYRKVILLDPSVHTEQILPGDILVPYIDILTVKGGVFSVQQTLDIIQREQQVLNGNITVIVVMNDKKSINPFSITGCSLLLYRFFIAPFTFFKNRRCI